MLPGADARAAAAARPVTQSVHTAFAVLVSVLAVLCAAPTAGAATLRFRVDVTNARGTPLPDIRVGLDGDSASASTDSRGSVAISVAPGSTPTLRLYVGRGCPSGSASTEPASEDPLIPIPLASLVAGSATVQLRQTQQPFDSAAWERAVVRDDMTLAERQLFHLINAYRARLGIAPVVALKRLNHLAVRHSRFQQASGAMTHCGDLGLMPHHRAQYEGIRGNAGNEVIGYASSAAAMLDIWIASEPHRLIISDPRARAVGIGWSGYVTADFYTDDCAALETDTSVCAEADTAMQTSTSIAIASAVARMRPCSRGWCGALTTSAVLQGPHPSDGLPLTVQVRGVAGRVTSSATRSTSNGAARYSLPLQASRTCVRRFGRSGCLRRAVTSVAWSFAGSAAYLRSSSSRIAQLRFVAAH